MIGHRTHFWENDDLPLRRGPAAKKKPPFFNACALIACEIMRSRDAQMQYWGMTLIRLWTTLSCCLLCLMKVTTQVKWTLTLILKLPTKYYVANRTFLEENKVTWNENGIIFNFIFLKSYLTLCPMYIFKFITLIGNIIVNTIHVPSICSSTMTFKIQKYRGKLCWGTSRSDATI